MDLEERAVAASWTVADDRLVRWQAGFEEMFGLVAGQFAQANSRWRARKYVLGLPSAAERKNSWTICRTATLPLGTPRVRETGPAGLPMPARSPGTLGLFRNRLGSGRRTMPWRSA